MNESFVATSPTSEPLMTAAVACALLGLQGSPAWARTAETLLLSSIDVRQAHNDAVRELDTLLAGGGR